MLPEPFLDVVDSLLQNAALGSHSLGGLEFYGHSTEFRDLLRLCLDFGTPVEPNNGLIQRAYIFLDDSHGKSSLARAIAIQTEANGGVAHRFDGALGSTAKELKELQQNTNPLVVVDGLPEASAARSTLLDRFNTLRGRAILFARPEYMKDAHLRPETLSLRIVHVDERPLDKIAWLIGLVREQLRDERGLVSEELANAVRHLPVNLLATLCSMRLGGRVAEIELLAAGIAQALRLSVGLGTGHPLRDDELAAVFVDFFSSGTQQVESRFRLWVEGESDLRVLMLVCRLAAQALGFDLSEGLAIIPLGLGREGGTSKATEVVIGKGTRRNRDIFLFDADSPGRHAEQELKTLDQEVLFLDAKIACSRVEPDVEIEDFISLGCLDRFYASNADLRPEKETIRYKPPISRRLLVDGAHKEQLMQWLEANATLAELENLVFVLCDVRSRFSLRSLPAAKDKQIWRRNLIEDTNQYKHFGARPSHWML